MLKPSFLTNFDQFWPILTNFWLKVFRFDDAASSVDKAMLKPSFFLKKQPFSTLTLKPLPISADCSATIAFVYTNSWFFKAEASTSLPRWAEALILQTRSLDVAALIAFGSTNSWFLRPEHLTSLLWLTSATRTADFWNPNLDFWTRRASAANPFSLPRFCYKRAEH